LRTRSILRLLGTKRITSDSAPQSNDAEARREMRPTRWRAAPRLTRNLRDENRDSRCLHRERKALFHRFLSAAIRIKRSRTAVVPRADEDHHHEHMPAVSIGTPTIPSPVAGTTSSLLPSAHESPTVMGRCRLGRGSPSARARPSSGVDTRRGASRALLSPRRHICFHEPTLLPL